MRTRLAGASLAGLVLAASAACAQGDQPLSAIDWLSQSVAPPPATAAAPAPNPAPRPRPAEPPVTAGAATPGITVTPLDRPDAAPVGVIDPEDVGLPAALWAASPTPLLIDLLRAGPPETLPALQDLVVELMLARAAPSADGGGPTLALARVDRLLDMGSLDAADRLLRAGELLDREWFRRWFDVTLLRGSESEACAILRDHPALAPTLEARVFCLARNGDWDAAALTLGTARALGDVTPEDETLLARFLDSEIEPPSAEAAPARPSPLVYRIREAVGDLMPTTGLPLAFAHADLRTTVAWRNQIEAAERLARRGALAPETLRQIYLARTPAASGGVWDRAAAVQALDAAMASGDVDAVAAALPAAWIALDEAGLVSPLARLYGPGLARLDIAGPARDAALRLGLLSADYREAARRLDPASPAEALWRAVALGDPMEGATSDPAAAAALDGLNAGPVPDALAGLISEGRVGEAGLRAVADFGEGLDGDYRAVAGALATLMALGQEDVARRAALEYLLLGAGR